jgi:hypothetical protein
MAENLEDKKLEDFDIEKAQKLLDSIRYMSDIRNFLVQKPNSVMMEMTTLKEWVRWYAKQTEWNGQDGTENEVMKVLDNLYYNLKILTERVESGFEKLLTALDRKDIKVKLLLSQVDVLKEQIRLMEEKEKQRLSPTKQSQNNSSGDQNAPTQNTPDPNAPDPTTTQQTTQQPQQRIVNLGLAAGIRKPKP